MSIVLPDSRKGHQKGDSCDNSTIIYALMEAYSALLH